MASVQLWKETENEAPVQPGNRLLQSLAFTKPASHQKPEARAVSEQSEAGEDEDDSGEVAIASPSTSMAPRSFKLIVGSRAVEIDARDKCKSR